MWSNNQTWIDFAFICIHMYPFILASLCVYAYCVCMCLCQLFMWHWSSLFYPDAVYLHFVLILLCRITAQLRFFENDYVQGFMAEAISFLLRNSSLTELRKGTSIRFGYFSTMWVAISLNWLFWSVQLALYIFNL